MGLDLVLLRADFDGTRARWSYSGFNAFRARLAGELGFRLDEMRGFGGERSWDEVADPLVPLLNHSDCDGELGYSDCETVEPRLREVVADWDDDDYNKVMALHLCDMMREVVAGEAEAVSFR